MNTFAPPSSIDGISLGSLDSSLSILERLRIARNQVSALKERVAGMRKAQENDIDWATCGRGPDPNNSFRFEIRRLLRGHFNKVHACAWAGDDTTAASASQDGKMIIWNAFTRDKLDVIFLESNFAMSCAFESQTDSLVATGGLDNKCSVFAVGDGAVTKMRSVGASYAREPVAELVGHEGYVSDIAFCSGQVGPAGRLLTASGDGTVALWDLNASSSTGVEGGRRSIVSSLSGRNILGGGGGGARSKEGKGGAAISVFSDHQADVMCVAVNPMDPNVFASGSCDKTLKIWDIRRPRAVCSFEGHRSDVNTVKFFPNGLSVCTGSDDSSCRVFDLRSCGPILVLSDERQQSGVTDVAVSKSGRLVFASYEETCKQVAVSSESEKTKAAVRAAALALSASGKSAEESEDAARTADSTAKAIASSSPTGDRLSSSSNLPCHVIAWETISSIGLFHEMRGNTKRVSSLSVNSSGQALLAANWDHNLTVWA